MPWLRFFNFSVHMTRKVRHFKNSPIWKAFQSRIKWRFSFSNIFFCSRDIPVFLFCKFSHSCHHRLSKYSGVTTKLWLPPPIMKQCYWNLTGMLQPAKYTRWYTFLGCYGKMLCASPFLLKIKYYHLRLNNASPTFMGLLFNISNSIVWSVQLQMVTLDF